MALMWWSNSDFFNIEAPRFFRAWSLLLDLLCLASRKRKRELDCTGEVLMGHTWMWHALFLPSFHLPKLSQMVISNLREGWKNLICVYALKDGKTWIPVKLAVSGMFDFKIQKILFYRSILCTVEPVF